MSETTSVTSEAAPPPPRHLDELALAVERLDRELHALRADLAREVRTNRLTVVDDDGYERVVVASHGDHGQVSVRGRSAPQRSTTVELFANDPADGDGAHVGVALSDDGDVVGLFDLLHGAEARVRIEQVVAEGSG